MMTPLEFQTLFDALRERGVTQEKLAAMLGTTQVVVSNWYRGKQLISPRFVTRLRLLQAVINNTGYAAAVLDAIETCREMLARLDVIAEQTGKDTFAAQQQVKAIMAALQADAAWINTITINGKGLAFSGDHSISE